MKGQRGPTRNSGRAGTKVKSGCLVKNPTHAVSCQRTWSNPALRAECGRQGYYREKGGRKSGNCETEVPRTSARPRVAAGRSGLMFPLRRFEPGGQPWRATQADLVLPRRGRRGDILVNKLKVALSFLA